MASISVFLTVFCRTSQGRVGHQEDVLVSEHQSEFRTEATIIWARNVLRFLTVPSNTMHAVQMYKSQKQPRTMPGEHQIQMKDQDTSQSPIPRPSPERQHNTRRRRTHGLPIQALELRSIRSSHVLRLPEDLRLVGRLVVAPFPVEVQPGNGELRSPRCEGSR